MVKDGGAITDVLVVPIVVVKATTWLLMDESTKSSDIAECMF